MAKIEKNTVIQNGIVMGFVKLPGHNDPIDFEIISVREWVKLSDNDADTKATGCFHESGIATDYDLEYVDWWY